MDVVVRLRCHWVAIVILHWDRRNCWMGKGHLAQRIISPPPKCLNTISLLSHCSSLLCLSNTMFVCCLYAPVQSPDCSECYSCPSVRMSRKMSLFSPIPLLTFIFFVSWSVYTLFNPLPRIFRGITESLDGEKEFFPKKCFKMCREVDPSWLLPGELHSYSIYRRSPKRWHLHTIMTIICKLEKFSSPGSGQLELPGSFSTYKCLKKLIFRF